MLCCDQVVFFAISLILLLWVLNDEKVETSEASMLLAGYLVRLTASTSTKLIVSFDWET